MWLFVCTFAAALAGTPTIKGTKLLDDGTHVMNVKTSSMFGTSMTTITARDGTPIAAFNLVSISTDQGMLSADFSALGTTFGGTLPTTAPAELVIAWWTAGALGPDGGNAENLAAWAGEHGMALRDSAADREKFAAYASSRQPMAFAPLTAPAATAAPTRPATPSSVSVSLTISCKQNVRMFFGSSPTSGGSYGWESPNSVRSVSMAPGAVACITDAQDHIQSCWTAPSSPSASLDVGCAGLTGR
jgi:hypothetical protein